MNCARCSNDMVSSLMNAMCGIEMWTARHSLDCRRWPSCAPTGPNKPAWGNAPGWSWSPICFPALKGRNRTVCAALSGLDRFFATLSQGVALGWFVVAPSGRHCTRSGQRSLLCRFAFLLFLVGSPLFAANSPLADAAEKSDRATIRTLLKQHADVNAPQADGMTALHWAAHLDDFETAKTLADAHANVAVTNRYGVTPLSLACQNGNASIIELLLERGADPNTTLRGGETVLMTAARTGKAGAVKALLKRGAGVNAKERRGQTALMWAAADGHTEVVELLIKAGADIHATLPESGFTSLLFAARDGRADVARILLQAGVD